jgi:hypothetical protein
MGGPISDIILCCQRKGIRTIDVRREQRAAMMASSKVPIHPLRLCYEVREVLKRDAIGADRV